jgi:hypothetical protein
VGAQVAGRGDLGGDEAVSVIRLPSWREVMEGPWALRLRSGSTGPWLMRGEADDAMLDVRFVAGGAARTTLDALSELGTAFELEVPLGGFDDLPDALRPGRPVALLVLDADKLLADDPAQLAPLVAALRSAADRVHLRVIFQARELSADAEAVLTEFGVAEIRA